MKTLKNKLAVFGVSIMAVFLITGCSDDADVVSQNLSKDADNFKVQRKITFINTVSDEVLYTVEGNMSVYADTEDNQLEITAQTGADKYQKHILGLSPTTVYIVEQTEWNEANKYNFKITLKPSAIIPEVEVR